MKCLECGSQNVITQNSEVICRVCGLVLDDEPLTIPMCEDRAPAVKLIDQFAGSQPKSGKYMPSSWLISNKEKKKVALFSQARNLSEKLSLPKHVLDLAKELIYDLQEKDFFRGRDKNAIVVACMYSSCLVSGLPRTHLDFELASKINRHKILKYYVQVSDFLKMEFRRFSVRDLIEYYASKLNIVGNVLDDALKINRRVRFEGVSAYIVATAILYKSAKINNYNLTQRRLAYASGVHEVSLRRHLRSLI